MHLVKVNLIFCTCVGFSSVVDWWVQNSTYTYNFVGVLVFIVGVVGVWYGWKTYRANDTAQKVQNRALLDQNEALLFQNAVQIYRRYIELAVEYPQFAEPNDHPPPTTPIEMGRYEWFVGLLLRACEEILQFVESANEDRQKEWRTIVRTQLEYHGRYFATDEWFRRNAEAIYSPAVMAIIRPIVIAWELAQAKI